MYDWLLFDLDETLMEFNKASNASLMHSFAHFNIPHNSQSLATYQTVNREVWRAFENQEITVDELIHLRIERFLKLMGLTHIPPLDLNDHYLDQLGQNSYYYEGVEDVLTTLKRMGFQMAIVTNGLTRVQRYRWENTTLPNYFEDIFISQEIGKPKPHQQFFDHVHAAIKRPQRHRVLVIGDNPESDIKGANAFGYASCWIDRGHNRLSPPKSDYHLKSLSELLSIIS